MDKVNKELNSYLSKYLKYRFEDNYLNKNMLDDVSNKFALINFILEENEMQKETNYAASGIGRQDFSYIDIDTYKNMYKKIYGSLNDFETEVKNVSPPVFDMANNIDSTMSSDLVAWNSTYGATTQKVTLETKNIVYDKNNKQYKITGTVNYESEVEDITPKSYKHDFELIYATSTEQNYLISLVLS